MVETAALILVYVTFLAFASKRLMTYMHVLQQEEYDNSRLTKWMGEHKAFDKRLSFALIVLTAVWAYIPTFFMSFLIFISMVIITYLEKDPRKSLKKKLVATDRAKRIFFPTLALIALLGAWCFVPLAPYNMLPLPWVLVIQLIPVCLLLVNTMLKPFEKIIQQIYWNEARAKLNSLRPIIIGVTGSFGKTSVKHILGHILSTQAATLVTPGSVNTAMGITRIIREQLNENHKYFIVEMGAYGPGSIAELCRLTPPDMGIITTIGHAHYERFKSLETVAHAKFELAEAVLKKDDGKVVIHERTMRFGHPRSLKVNNSDRFVVCGEPPEIDPQKRKDICYLEKGDIHIIEVKQNAKGLDIKIGVKDMVYNLNPPLYGLHHGHNTVLAAAAALSLGIDINTIQLALYSLPQISHRLEVKPKPEEGYTLIDDAYNSNPIGFRSALDLMTLINNGGRKILITPGMIELGIAHDEIHEQVALYAGKVCDIAVVVNPERIPTFIKGFKSGGAGKMLVEVSSFKEASDWLAKNKQPNDLVLIENDLPDMYERIPSM